MLVKFLMAQNDKDWAIAGHSKLLGDLSQLELVVTSGMPGKITMQVIEVDLETGKVHSMHPYEGEK